MAKVEKITQKLQLHIKISSFAMKTAQKELKNLLLPSNASDRKTVTFFWTTLYVLLRTIPDQHNVLHFREGKTRFIRHDPLYRGRSPQTTAGKFSSECFSKTSRICLKIQSMIAYSAGSQNLLRTKEQ